MIAAYGEHVVMKETLAEALSALFTEPDVAAAPGAAVETAGEGAAAKRAQQALDGYRRAMQQLKSGDWAGFGKQMDTLRDLLEDMSRESGGR